MPNPNRTYKKIGDQCGIKFSMQVVEDARLVPEEFRPMAAWDTSGGDYKILNHAVSEKVLPHYSVQRSGKRGQIIYVEIESAEIFLNAWKAPPSPKQLDLPTEPGNGNKRTEPDITARLFGELFCRISKMEAHQIETSRSLSVLLDQLGVDVKSAGRGLSGF